MSWPPNGDAIPNTTIESGKYNAFRADLLQDLNTARPVQMGGTGANTAVSGADALTPAGATMASAATVDLATSTGVSLLISGTTAISSFGVMPAGVKRELTFLAAATLTNSATLILPGGADILTAAGDTATMRSLGGGTWRCTAYQRASGQPVSKAVDGLIANDALTVKSVDGGAGAGPIADIFRDSASPAANDFLGQIQFNGRNDAAAKKAFATTYSVISNPVAGSETGLWVVQTVQTGVLANRLLVGLGAYMSGATGGDKGDGTFNAFVATHEILKG